MSILASPFVLLIAVAYGAMTAFCVAVPRHYAQVLAEAPSARTTATLRVVGGVLLALGFAGAWSSFGAAMGIVAWLGSLSVAALILVLGLWPWAPRAAVVLALVVTLVAAPAILL